MRISNTRDDHIRQPKNKSNHPKDIRFSCAYFRHSKRPFRAALTQVLQSQAHPFFVRVFQTLEVTIIASTPTSIFTPRTSIFVRIFQTLEVTISKPKKKSIYPKDIHTNARISNTRGEHFRQLQNKSFHSTDTLSRAHISNTPR